MEEWRDIEGYEGLYQVSNFGRVKSLARKVKRGDHFFSVKSRVLKADVNTRGYSYVNLSLNGKPKKRTVHQLVAIAFLGHTPCGHEIVVDHINNDKLDNRVDNLQLTTNRHNSSKDKKGGSSKYTGVCWHKPSSKWHSYIKIGSRNVYLGSFDSEVDAASAYKNKLKKLCLG